MDRTISRGSLALAILVSVMLVVAGCASVPAPGSPLVPGQSKTTAPTKIPATMTPSPVKTVKTFPPVPTTTAIPQSVTPIPISTLTGSRYSVDTCSGLGGFVVSPGDRCPGVWLDTTGTFSCCSLKPVPETRSNVSVAVAARPLDLHVNLTDDPGRIVP